MNLKHDTGELHGRGLEGYVTLTRTRLSCWLNRSLSRLCSEEMLKGMCLSIPFLGEKLLSTKVCSWLEGMIAEYLIANIVKKINPDKVSGPLY